MNLILIRHADAEAAAVSDCERALTDKGRRQARRVGRFLVGAGAAPALLLASPLARARQTAQLIAEEAGVGAVEVEDDLAAGMRPQEGLAVFARHGERAAPLALVGHEPDLSALAAVITGMGSGANIKVKKAACLAFALAVPRAGAGVLLWHVPCSLMG